MSELFKPSEETPVAPHAPEGSTGSHPLPEHLPHDIYQEHHDPDVSLGGLRAVIVKFKLRSVQRELDALNGQKENSERDNQVNGAVLDKNGRRAVVATGYLATYGKKGKVGRLDPSTITNPKAAKKYQENVENIEKSMQRVTGSDAHRSHLKKRKDSLEKKLGIEHNEEKKEDQKKFTTGNELHAKNNETRTEKALVLTIQGLIEYDHASVDEATVERLLKDMDGFSPVLAKFTLQRLRNLGIINRQGKIIKTHDALNTKIDALTAPVDTLSSPYVTKERPSRTDIAVPLANTIGDDSLEELNQLIEKATLEYLGKNKGKVKSKHEDKDKKQLRVDAIRSFLGPDATDKEIHRVEKRLEELVNPDSKIKVMSETPAERRARVIEEKALAKQKAEEAEWAWAGKEEPQPTESKKAEDAYEELLKTVPNA